MTTRPPPAADESIPPRPRRARRPKSADDSAFATARDAWFAARKHVPFPFQRDVWQAMARGASGLLHADTGAGKTLAVWFGALGREARLGTPPGRTGILWLTPMRALAADTLKALRAAAPVLGEGWQVEARSGDTSGADRARQQRHPPSALVTTPESATLMLTRADADALLGAIHTVVVDEWHELIGNKRGVQVQLLIARLRVLRPDLAVWGMSATLGNLDEAMATLLGPPVPGVLVRGRQDKQLRVDTLLPDRPGRFSWTGHLGAQMQGPVAAEIERSMADGGSTLIFTNVRSQAEAWYQLLLSQRPEWAGKLALHHGSLSHEVRQWVEGALKSGELAAVVATSSLDLGVDFLPVERVLQIGSPKGVARLLQRAGRSGHQPGRVSRLTLVPTNTLELIEAAAARRAIAAGRVEARHAPEAPLDVLVQHLVTRALGGGFRPDELFAEVRLAHSFRHLDRSSFDWALAFVVHGGSSLSAYPEHHRVTVRADGLHVVEQRGMAQRHRLAVGTIVADSSVLLKWWKRGPASGTLGQVEESFIGRLKPGDAFVFAGRSLELVRTEDMTAWVIPAAGRRGALPSWNGSRMSLSSEMADASLAVLADAADVLERGTDAEAAPAFAGEPELVAALPMLRAQQRLSAIPRPDRLVIERLTSREGWHLFVHPVAGRAVHLGLASLLAWRLGRHVPNTFSLSVNDFGFELLAAVEPDATLLDEPAELFTEGPDLLAEVLASLNRSELARRRFREIARIAGLVQTGFPGAPRSTRQLQASAGLFYDVFRRHDPDNRLLWQAEAEVLAQELEIEALRAALARMRARPMRQIVLEAPSPFALALMAERFREQLSTEKLADRLQRLVSQAEKVLDRPPRPARPRRAKLP